MATVLPRSTRGFPYQTPEEIDWLLSELTGSDEWYWGSVGDHGASSGCDRHLLILTVAKAGVQVSYDEHNTGYQCNVVIQESDHASQKTISLKLAD
ncbi:hypothetical protein [Pseudomonas sp. MIACH]|uniref:hypothetical protein n=1 Tax=Pseudomonas sp. MIACH TaxID=1078355 RepID=UPI0012E1AE44|nr:hypothetical protein [Pseudomonas sp. MIACH]